MPEKRGHLKAVLSPDARRDLREALRWSETKFGHNSRFDAELRYEALIVQALRDIETDPARPENTNVIEIAASFTMAEICNVIFLKGTGARLRPVGGERRRRAQEHTQGSGDFQHGATASPEQKNK